MAVLLTCSGLNVIGVINDLSAAAISWGFYRTDITTPVKVMFLTMGSNNFSAAVAEFAPGQVTILSAVHDAHLGGDNIDFAVAEKFVKNFQDKHKLDIKSNQRAWFRLFLTVERVKKNLNENEQSGMSIECLLEDRDLNEKLTKNEYISILQDLDYYNRLEKVVNQALADANLTKEELDDVEWLGSGLRIVPLRDHITSLLGKSRLSNTMNAEEAVAKVNEPHVTFLEPYFVRVVHFTAPC